MTNSHEVPMPIGDELDLVEGLMRSAAKRGAFLGLQASVESILCELSPGARRQVLEHLDRKAETIAEQVVLDTREEGNPER